MKILVVEDEGLIANNLSDSLRKSGYEISGISASGEDALEKVVSLKPDLVLMDIHLSGEIDGIEAAEKVRSSFSIPVIFLTAHANAENLDRAKRTHPFGYLVKPIRQVDLISAIEIAAYTHEMDRKLKQREAWLATTIRCAGDAVIITDAAGSIESFNELAKLLLGIQDRDITGAKFSDFIRLRNRFTGASAGDLVQLAILDGATINIGSDLVLMNSFGQESDIEGEVAVCETDGSIVGTVFTFRDVTVRNHREEQQRYDRGHTATARLAGAVSAELRLLQHAPVEGNNESAEDEGLHAQRTNGISRIVDELDTVRSVNVPFPSVLDLNRLISELCSDLRPTMMFPMKLTSELDPKLHPVYADPLQIRHAITNLILYGEKAMPRGGVIHLSTRNSNLERRGRAGHEDNYVTLTVHHSGQEMEPEKAYRLFEPFSGAEPSVDALDLRLFIVHGIVSAAQGWIRAQCRPGQGTSFEVLLPISTNTKDSPQVDSKATAGVHTATTNAVVLILHTDPHIRALISASLESEGRETLGARSFGEALEWLTIPPGPIALFISDWELFHTYGSNLAEEISIQHPGMRAIFTLDHSIEPAVQKRWETYGARFLPKPFRLDELLSVVDEMLADEQLRHFPALTNQS